MDLAEGHVAALNNLNKGVNIYNLGTGQGTSVLDGDIASCYADVSKAKRELDWTSKRDIITMSRDTWAFEKNYEE